MKIVRRAIVIIGLGYIILSCLIACIPTHSVTFINDACIIPYKKYDYHTCRAMYVTIDGEIYVIPRHFTTDLASIPKPLWSFISPQYAGYVAPSILHDYLYSCSNLCTRRYADEVLYSALLSKGVSQFTAAKFYFAVRIFGKNHFAKGNHICTKIGDDFNDDRREISILYDNYFGTRRGIIS